MSRQCRTTEVPLRQLAPRYVEFTGTRGVLRCLRAGESRTRAQGLIFMCPACKGKKEKEHYNIFLFNLPTVNPEARPQGRFLTTMTLDALGNPVPEDFDAVSLFVSHVNDNSTLAPQDVCGWEGQLSNGVVSWRPSWLARLIK